MAKASVVANVVAVPGNAMTPSNALTV